MTVIVDEKKISLYEKISKIQKEPSEIIHFSSIIDVDDDVDKARAAMENIPDAEKRCLFRVN